MKVMIRRKFIDNLNEVGVGEDKQIGEVIRWLNFVEERVDIVVLYEVTAPCADDINAIWDYGSGVCIAGSGDFLDSAYVVFVMF